MRVRTLYARPNSSSVIRSIIHFTTKECLILSGRWGSTCTPKWALPHSYIFLEFQLNILGVWRGCLLPQVFLGLLKAKYFLCLFFEWWGGGIVYLHPEWSLPHYSFSLFSIQFLRWGWMPQMSHPPNSSSFLEFQFNFRVVGGGESACRSKCFSPIIPVFGFSI